MDMVRLERSRATFLNILFGGKREMTEEEAMQRAARLGLSFLRPPFVVAIIAPVYTQDPQTNPDDRLFEYEEYVNYQLKKSGFAVATSTDISCRVRVLLPLGGKDREGIDLDELFISLHKKLLLRFGYELFISIGGVVDALNQVVVSFQDANEMQAYKYQYASRGVSNIANRMRFEHSRYVGNNVAVERVVGCFHDGDLGKMSARLDELIEQVRFRPGVSKTSIRRTMVNLTMSVLNIATNAGVDVDEVLDGKDPYRWLMTVRSTPEQKEWFMKLCTTLLQRMQEKRETEEKQVITLACGFVQNNLHRNDLSLRMVSDHVGLSSSYFSQMFKKEMGEGINAYISRSRIERAKNLLATTDIKNEEIALQVGFSTVNYFSTVFKSNVGQSPAEFRRKSFENTDKS